MLGAAGAAVAAGAGATDSKDEGTDEQAAVMIPMTDKLNAVITNFLLNFISLSSFT